MSEQMDGQEKQCPKCAGAMEQGFVADLMGPLAGDVSKWNPGPPKSAFFTLTKRSYKELPMAAFRCASCGYVEFYAAKEFGRQ
ncbi:PF20097 family protein [Lacipirellula sp.]|uniref:PF20097 family protein n=1 Tax=Lacipirellula sp. TaxID=2691419 RepID=UPI003D0A64C0